MLCSTSLQNWFNDHGIDRAIIHSEIHWCSERNRLQITGRYGAEQDVVSSSKFRRNFVSESNLPSTDIMHSTPLFKPNSDALQDSSHLGRHLTGTQCSKDQIDRERERQESERLAADLTLILAGNTHTQRNTPTPTHTHSCSEVAILWSTS